MKDPKDLPKPNATMSHSSVCLFWLYPLAGGVEGSKEADSLMLEPYWWGSAESVFGMTKEECKAQLPMIIDKCNKHQKTAWILVARALKQKVASKLASHRMNMEEQQYKVEQQVWKLDDRVTGLENAAPAAVEVSEKAPVPVDRLEILDYPWVKKSAWDKPAIVTDKKVGPIVAILGECEKKGYDVKYKAGERKWIAKGHKNLDPDQVEAHRLLNIKY